MFQKSHRRSYIRNLLACVIAASAMVVPANAAAVIVANNYHAQITSFFCGPSSLEMMLDTPAVRATNPLVNAMFNANGPGDPAQLFIYNSIHGLNFTPLFGPGTDPVGFSLGINSFDNPNVLNPLSGYTTTAGTHGYAWYGFVPQLAAGDLASRTVAAALAIYNVPATVSINHGGHWIDVNGVSYSAPPAFNQPYKINGFFVRDPWTGFALTHPGAGSLGLGINAYLRYGVDIINGQVRLAPWFQYFTPTGPLPGTPYGGQYIIEVEPQGPELQDTGDGTSEDSFPTPPTDIPELNAAGAFADVAGDLASVDTLSGDFSGGTWDTGDETFMQFPGDPTGEGDWVIPYDGGGGVNDVTGFVMIDADTGVLDEASWFGPTDPITSMTLAQFDQMVFDETNGILPEDNHTPEPAAGLLVVPGLALLWWKRRRQIATAK